PEIRSSFIRLKVEPQLCRIRPWRNKVRSTKSREEVIKRGLIGDVDRTQLHAPLIAVAVKEIVMSHGKIKEIAWSDPRWIVVIVFSAGSRNRDTRSPKL